MRTKNVKSRLFKGSPDQLLLDERVSKIALPTLDDDRVVMDEREANWGLNPHEEEDPEVTEKLQIFVGLPQKESAVEWDISEDDNPFWDEDDSPLDELPVPMALSLNPAEITVETAETTTLNLPPGLPLQSIQEIHEDITNAEVETDPDESDEWGQIQWDDVTLSDILGDLDDVVEVDDDPAGASLMIGLAETTAPIEEEVFPALVSIEDIPVWEESWEQDDTDPVGPSLNLEEEWFSETDGDVSLAPEVHAVTPQRTPKTYTGSNRPPPPRIVLRQSHGFWEDPIVRVWLMILGVALIAAIVWRILQIV